MRTNLLSMLCTAMLAATVHLPTPMDDCEYLVTVHDPKGDYTLCAADMVSRPDEDATLIVMRGMDGLLRPELIRDPITSEPVKRMEGM